MQTVQTESLKVYASQQLTLVPERQTDKANKEEK